MQIVKVVNLKCGGCANSIKNALKNVGIENVEVFPEKGEVHFEGDKDLVAKTLAKIRYPKEGSKEAKSLLKKGLSYLTCAVGETFGS